MRPDGQNHCQPSWRGREAASRETLWRPALRYAASSAYHAGVRLGPADRNSRTLSHRGNTGNRQDDIHHHDVRHHPGGRTHRGRPHQVAARERAPDPDMPATHRTVRRSRRELAEALGVHYQTVGYLERGEYAPSLHLALRIARYFDVPVESVFSLEDFPRLS